MSFNLVAKWQLLVALSQHLALVRQYLSPAVVVIHATLIARDTPALTTTTTHTLIIADATTVVVKNAVGGSSGKTKIAAQNAMIAVTNP